MLEAARRIEAHCHSEPTSIDRSPHP